MIARRLRNVIGWHPLWAFAFYLLWSIALAWPLASHLGSVIASDSGDPILNAWILWWSTHVMPLTDRWWNANVFYPATGALTFSETLLGIIPLSAPIQWISGNPALAYNAPVFLSFSLSGLTAYLLCYELTRRHDAAFIGGLAFAFAPYRLDQLPHVQVLSTYWMPVVLLALHRYLRDRRPRWLALFAVAYVLQGLSNGYFLLYIPTLLLLWVLWFVPLRDWRALGSIALAGASTLVILVPVLLRFQQVHDHYGLVRSPEEIKFYSANLTAFLAPSGYLRYWHVFDHFQRPEGQLFPGGTIVVLVLAGALCRPWRRHSYWPRPFRIAGALLGTVALALLIAVSVRLVSGPWRFDPFGYRVSVTRIDRPLMAAIVLGLLWELNRWFAERRSSVRGPGRPASAEASAPRLPASVIVHRVFGTLVVAVIIGLAVRLAIGPWRLDLIGIRLSVDSPDKAIALIFWLGLAWLLTTARALRARTAGSAFPFYVLAVPMLYLLGMGPSPSLDGQQFFYQAPYSWLMHLPGYDGLRVPTRIWMLGAFCLAIAGGLAFQRIARARWTPQLRWGLVALFGAGILVDGWAREFPTGQLPPRSPLLEQYAQGPVVEMPMGGVGEDLGAMYRTIYHGQATANGYSGFFAPHYPMLVESTASLPPDLIAELGAIGVRTVSIKRGFTESPAMEAYMSAAPGVTRVAANEREVIFRLDAPPSVDFGTDLTFGPPIPVVALSATNKPDEVASALDRDLATRWDTGEPQRPGEELRIDLGAAKPVGAIVLELGRSSSDFPRLLSIQISSDRTSWQEVWSGPTSGRSLMAGMKYPQVVPLSFPLDGRPARYIKLLQLGSARNEYWSIAELYIYAPK